MVRKFDILKVGDGGQTAFLEAALTLEAAMTRAQELAALRRGAYQIYSHITGITFPVTLNSRVREDH